MPSNAEFLNEVGTKLSDMDFQLGAATERLGVAVQSPEVVAARMYVANAHTMLGTAGAALADLAAAVLGTSPTPQPEPELVFTGPVSVVGLNALDLAFYQKEGMGQRVNQVINGTLTQLNSWIGDNYEEAKKYQAKPFRTELDNYNGPLKGL